MKLAKDYIIFPLDVPTADRAMSYVNRLAEHVGLFKVGLELFISEGPALLGAIRRAGSAGIFLDLKLHDIPATMQRAMKAAARHRPEFVTVHCDEGGGFLKETVKDNPDTKILGITVLTSLDAPKLEAMGYDEAYVKDIAALVLLRARLAKEAGCHGVVCSGLEVSGIKKAFGPDFMAMTPGIRPVWTLVEGDDQKRIVTPAAAVKNGADYVVIGRPIRDAEIPADAADRVAEEIAAAL
ncbi:MAG: orotidine-5'-phosphate decarboxylase [Deltaproteobacteria bacterium]|nr:orotidine-5'-phosphate decarboxylase [Deltaproteobacteria bacterium]MBW1818836.1 orotidine-5'-phosphate decarboxylase [Deltaproteobacteria bacterium]MBW2284967.1 orotidine-5'-phosphate decarboxylase [Deltaproteobacteria bacterium]